MYASVKVEDKNSPADISKSMCGKKTPRLVACLISWKNLSGIKKTRKSQVKKKKGMFGKMASVFKGNSSSNEYQTKLALYPACELVLYKSKVALRENKL